MSRVYPTSDRSQGHESPVAGFSDPPGCRREDPQFLIVAESGRDPHEGKAPATGCATPHQPSATHPSLCTPHLYTTLTPPRESPPCVAERAPQGERAPPARRHLHCNRFPGIGFQQRNELPVPALRLLVPLW